MTTIYLVERSASYDQWAPIRAYQTKAAADAYVQQCDEYSMSFPRHIRWDAPDEDLAKVEEAQRHWWGNRPDPEMQPSDGYMVTPTTLHDE